MNDQLKRLREWARSFDSLGSWSGKPDAKSPYLVRAAVLAEIDRLLAEPEPVPPAVTDEAAP